jgi:hypothetical protein
VDVELREITSETVRAICELEVATDQRSFVAPNAIPIAEGHFTLGHWMRPVYADGQPVGFVVRLQRFERICRAAGGGRCGEPSARRCWPARRVHVATGADAARARRPARKRV